MSTSLALGGTITLPQLAALLHRSHTSARLIAEHWGGPARSRLQGSHLTLYWPLPALADYLGGPYGPTGCLPGGWCTRRFAAEQLRDLPPARRAHLLSTRSSRRLIRHRAGTTRTGTPCTLYALADVLAAARCAAVLTA